MFSRLIALATLVSTAAASPPPAVLAPYVHGGRFDPGDYGWLRGSFAGASPKQRSAYRSFRTWLAGCHTAQATSVRGELARRGIETRADDQRLGNDGLCGEVGSAARIGDPGTSWPAFQAVVARVRPVAQTVVWSAALAQAQIDPGSPDEAAELLARPMTDQILRLATFWGNGEIKGAPLLDPAAHEVGNAMLWAAITRRDHANTAWLKALVAQSGWPTIGKVGAAASEQAWMLVQHADDDPVFQLDMLRLMEPLAARGEVSKRNYAMLYDRVMLALTGKQRYGSQAICAAGHQTPLPLEDGAGVDRLRRDAGMAPLHDYLAGMDRDFPCAPAVIPPSSPAR